MASHIQEFVIVYLIKNKIAAFRESAAQSTSRTRREHHMD